MVHIVVALWLMGRASQPLADSRLKYYIPTEVMHHIYGKYNFAKKRAIAYF